METGTCQDQPDVAACQATKCPDGSSASGHCHVIPADLTIDVPAPPSCYGDLAHPPRLSSSIKDMDGGAAPSYDGLSPVHMSTTGAPGIIRCCLRNRDTGTCNLLNFLIFFKRPQISPSLDVPAARALDPRLMVGPLVSLPMSEPIVSSLPHAHQAPERVPGMALMLSGQRLNPVSGGDHSAARSTIFSSSGLVGAGGRPPIGFGFGS